MNLHKAQLSTGYQYLTRLCPEGELMSQTFMFKINRSVSDENKGFNLPHDINQFLKKRTYELNRIKY